MIPMIGVFFSVVFIVFGIGSGLFSDDYLLLAPFYGMFVFIPSAIWILACPVIFWVTISEQIEDFIKYQNYDEEMAFKVSTLKEYTREMKDSLHDELKALDSKLFDSIKDSKLLATAFSESKYHETLLRYDENYVEFLRDIENTKRYKLRAKNQLLSRQSNYFGFGFLIPQKFRI